MKYLTHPLLYLIALLTNGEVVVLRDCHGETYWSIAWIDVWGVKYARPKTMLKVGHVQLLSNGSCVGNSSYIKQWKKA